MSEEYVDDFLVLENEMKWIGTFIKVERGYIVVLEENVHDWLIPFHDFFIGFRLVSG